MTEVCFKTKRLGCRNERVCSIVGDSLFRFARLTTILAITLISNCSSGTLLTSNLDERIVKLDYFPLGLYTVPINKLQEVQAGGFNLVQLYHDTQSLEEAISYLEAAEEAGLMVLQNMPRDFLDASDEFWIKWVTTLSAYDSLAWWYLPEEPTLRGVPRASLARLYTIIRQFDPKQRPAATYFGIEGPLTEWCEVVDIILAGCYPEYAGEPRSCMKTWIDNARKDCPSKPVIGVPSFFDTRDFGRTGGHPSVHEARFDAYTAIIAGAKGLNWFSYQNGIRLPDLWVGLKDIVKELKELTNIIKEQDELRTITVEVISGPEKSPRHSGQVYDSIQMLQKERDETYLLASNLAADTLVAEFSGLDPDVIAAEVLFEKRVIPISGGKFEDSFRQFDVHIYRLLTSISLSPLVEFISR